MWGVGRPKLPWAPFGPTLPIAAALVFFTLNLEGCAQRPEMSDGSAVGGYGPRPADVEVALRRGAAWTVFSVHPSHLVGPAGTLRFERGNMVGYLNQQPVHLSIAEGQLTGSVGGRVTVDYEELGGVVEISGVWNDGRVFFEITPETLRGTINAGSVREGPRSARAAAAAGPFTPLQNPLLSVGPSAGEYGRCQFVLDRLDQAGARVGTSICQGMPQPTRLEFPPQVETYLTRAEIVAVLLAVLSTAPQTDEDFRFSRDQ